MSDVQGGAFCYKGRAIEKVFIWCGGFICIPRKLLVSDMAFDVIDNPPF